MPPSFPSRSQPALRLLLLTVAVVLAAVVAHGRALDAGLVFDDVPIVRDNPLLDPGTPTAWSALVTAPWWPGAGHDLLWRPFTLLTFALQTAGGAGARGLHAANVGIHALVCLLLAGLAGSLCRSIRAATVAGLLMAVHPLTSETVTLLVGRADLLAASGVLVACLGALDLAPAHSRRRRVAALFLVACGSAVACLAKENGFVAPLLVLLVVRAGRGCSRDPGTSSRWRPRLPGLAAAGAAIAPAGAALLLRIAVLGQIMRTALPAFGDNPLAHAGLVDGRLTALRLLGHSLALFLRPWPLSIDYSFAQIAVPAASLATLAPVVGGTLALGAIFWLLRRRPVAVCGLLWFFLAQLPSANLVVTIGTIYAERLLYLPMAGLCLLAADLATGWSGPLLRGRLRSPSIPVQVGVAAVALLVLAAGTAQTRQRESDYVDELSVWRAATRAAPRSAKAHYNLGRSLAADGATAAAAREYRRAVRILPRHLQAWNNLGTAELRLSHPRAALVALARAARIAPHNPEVAFNQALALHRLGNEDEAVAAFRRGARLAPETAAALRARGEPWASLAIAAHRP
ncbi:MAG: tetratricopeptide repeat protein [Acidobacteriota bacterium]